MATAQEFFRNPLVTWVTSFRTTSLSENINDFADGVFLNEVMVEIDPMYFTLTRVHQNVDGDVNVRIQNLDILVRHLKAFYQEKLQQLVLMRAPDVVAIAHYPDSDVGLQELVKLMLLMLGCAVQCDNKESFIEKIKDMDFEVQKHLVEYIKQITENANHVLTFRMTELQESTIEHVLVVAESMFYQMGHLVEERDQSFADNTHLKLEKDLLLQERQRAKSPRPFSPPPADRHLAVDSPSMAVSKEKLRNITEELEEKNSLLAELKDEVLASKKMIEKLRQENKDLSQDAILVKAFRDQIDVLKVKADRVEKLDTDAVKFKEKLRDLDYFKKRAEELKEENVILLDNRQLLQEQLSSLSNKEERIEILEEENKKLKNHIHHIAEERQFEQQKLNEAMAAHAKLNVEKEESMAELASLSAEIEVLRGKSPAGSMNLASECQESSSMDVLRLSHQNEHLKKSLEDLRSSSTKLIDMERENRTLHQKYLEEKSTVHKLNEEMAKARIVNKQKTEEVEKVKKALHTLQGDLQLSSCELLNMSGEIKQKDVAIANLAQENYSQANELQEKFKDVEGKEMSMSSLKERVLNNENQLAALENKNKSKDRVINEKTKTIEELSESLHDKDRQVKLLQSRLDESVEDQCKADSQMRKQKKEIAELENKLEEEAIEKKKFEELVKEKENEILEYSQRFEEIQNAKMRSDDAVKRKDKEVHDLKNKLQVALDDYERLKDGSDGKEQKILSLHKRVEDLMKAADENADVCSQNLLEKDKQNRHFERRIEELTESVRDADKMKETIKQKDDKIKKLVKSLDEKEDQVRDIESRLEDANSHINKLGHTIKLKDKKIDALESSLTEVENSSFVVKDDRLTEIKKTVEVRDNKIVELENKVEDLTSLNNKLQHSVKIKETRMTDLESRIEEIESLTSEKNRLTQNLEQKMKQIIDLESSLEDNKDETLRLQHNWTQKSNKVKELEAKLVDSESYVELSQSLHQALNHKDDKISALYVNLQEKEEQLAELENKLEEGQAQNHKLKHAIKIKDEKITVFDNRIEELEGENTDVKKLSQMNEQKETKMKALETRLDELDGIANTNEKLKKSLEHREEKINRLQERLDEVEDAVNMNNKLNQHLKHRDNKIKALGRRILELEESLEVKEKEQLFNAQSSYAKIRELEASLEQVNSVKVQRQNSVKRREGKIDDLVHQRTQLEEFVQEREAKVVALQTRLDGSVDRYRQMDMTIGEREMKIAELEAKLTEANDACRENNKLRQMLKAKDARLTEFDNKVQMLESSLTKCEKREQERNDKSEILQKRLEETLNLNNRLDKSVRKKEENIRILEKTLQSNEKREEELEVLLETRTEKLSESKKRVLELNDVIENKDKEIEEFNIRLSEICSATTSEQKTATLLQEKDKQLEHVTERLEKVEADKTKISNTLQNREKQIEELEKRVGSSTVTQKETKITILTQNNKNLEENIFNLERQNEESNCQVNNLSRKLDQKDERIKGLKNRLEDAVHQNNKLTHALDLKEDKIRAIEERMEDSSKQIMQLREENQSRTSGRDKESKPGKASSTIIFKPAYNSRDDRKTVQMLSVADKRIADLNDEIRFLEKQNATIKTQSEGLSSRNAQLQIENDSLVTELRLVKGDYLSLQSELNDARDYYHQLDLSAVNMGHRCEMLSQLAATLEEENKALHDKVSWLMGQNRDLMVKSLEEKDHFMEDERFFSDRLYNLQRTKEKLEEQIDLANKALSEAAPPKKKPGFFKKIFKKGGPSKKKDDVKTPNKSQVQLLRADYHDNVDDVNRIPDHEDSYLRATPDRFDDSSSRDSSIGGDSGRSSKRNVPVTSTSSMMTSREIEEVQIRKVSHDVSAFRARQVRSEIFSDSFQPGQLSRPKSLDNLNKIGGFRGSIETLSSASAVTVDNVPSRDNRRGRRKTPPASPPSSAFRVVQRRDGSPYSTPVTTKRADVLRRIPTPQEDQPRKHSPQPLPERDSSQHSDNARAKSPSPSISRSRRSSFSSAISGHDSDHELERKDEGVSSKRSSIAERAPPPPYLAGLDSSIRSDRSDELPSQGKRSSIAERAPPPPYLAGLDSSIRSDRSDELPSQGRRSSRGPPPPYQRPSMDDAKQDDIPNVSSERRPPPYQEAAMSLKRTPSIRSKLGTPRESPLDRREGPLDRREGPLERREGPLERREGPLERRESPLDRREGPLDRRPNSPRQEQRSWENHSTPQSRRTEYLSLDAGSPIDRNTSIDSEPEILIDATESTVSAIPVSASPSASNRKTSKESTVISTFFQPVESLKESPLRRMNSMPRYNPRSKSIEESQGRKEPSKTTDTLFAAVLVRQRSLSDNTRRPDETVRRPKDLPGLVSESTPGQPSANSTIHEDADCQSRSGADSTLERLEECGSTVSREDSGSEGSRSKSKSGSRTPQRGKSTHQWLEYGCV